jgi:LacI family transcriptional regulator
MGSRSQRGVRQRPKARRDSRPVTLKKVAAHLGLSTTAVSLVLNGAAAAEAIPPMTRERIQMGVRELGYRPNHLARSLRSGRSHTVAVLLPEISDVHGMVLSGIGAQLLKEGYLYLVATHQARADLVDKQVRVFADRGVEGLIFVGTPPSAPPNLPAVLVSGDRALAGVTSVFIDDDLAARKVFSHLVSLGHRRIAFFKRTERHAGPDRRWRAIERVTEEFQLAIDPRLTMELENGRASSRPVSERAYEEGHGCARELLDRDVPFTALVALSDESAIGAVTALRKAGLDTPSDVSVIGLGDTESAALHSLTTIRPPLREMGEIAASTLLAQVRGAANFPFRNVEPQLLVRGSTAAAVAGPSRSGYRWPAHLWNDCLPDAQQFRTLDAALLAR